MSFFYKTGFPAMYMGLPSAGALVGNVSVIPNVSGTAPVVISCAQIIVPATTFGFIPVSTTNFAAPKSTVWYVCEPALAYARFHWVFRPRTCQ